MDFTSVSNWIVTYENYLKIASALLATSGTIILALRVKSLLELIRDVLNSHEMALVEIKDISENPKWNNAGRISAAVDTGLKNGMAVAIDKFHKKKGFYFLLVGFGTIILGSFLNLCLGLATIYL